MILAAGISSWTLTGIVRRYAVRSKLLDIPNPRSSHTLPTPRGGGLAIVITFAAALVLLGFARLVDIRTISVLLLSGGLISGVGLLDDRYSVSAGMRIAVQLVAALFFVFAIREVPDSVLADFGFRHHWTNTLLVVLALSWNTNLFNFMDGIDGIAGGEAMFIAGAGAYINFMQRGDLGLSAAMLCLCAASGGFLFWNLPTARIFLGDVGSGFFGLMLPMLGLVASQRSSIPVQVWVILGGLFAVDATITLLRRIARGDRWFEGHRLHCYQHLARCWNDHLRVTVLFGAINILWLFPWALYAASIPASATRCLIAALSPLAILSLLAGAGKQECIK